MSETLSTRNQIAAAVAALAFSSAAAAENLSARFDILRKGEPIGTHAVTVERRGEETVVETEIRMGVSFGPLPLFRYRHESREVWRDGVVESIESRTNDNGRKSALTARREGGDIAIDGTGFKGRTALERTIPSSYWNRAIVDATTLLNTQNGKLIPVETTSLGSTEAPGGATAEHFRLNGSVALDLWYDGPRWVAAKFVIRGEELTYIPEQSGDAPAAGAP